MLIAVRVINSLNDEGNGWNIEDFLSLLLCDLLVL